jgi:hypothetical protein
MIIFHYPQWTVRTCYQYLTQNQLTLGQDYRWSHDHDSGNLAVELADPAEELFYYMKLSTQTPGMTWKSK